MKPSDPVNSEKNPGAPPSAGSPWAIASVHPDNPPPTRKRLGISCFVLWGCLACMSLIAAPRLSAESASKSVQVTATILPRLELSVNPETGQGIVFQAIEQPAEGEQASRSVKVTIGVFSNLGHPYQVTQTLRRPLTSSAGSTIAEQHFQVSTRDAALGSLGAPQPSPTIPGVSTVLYTSNDRGKTDSFVADYTLIVTPKTPAGEYHTDILYTVTSL